MNWHKTLSLDGDNALELLGCKAEIKILAISMHMPLLGRRRTRFKISHMGEGNIQRRRK